VDHVVLKVVAKEDAAREGVVLVVAHLVVALKGDVDPVA
jgi:hypothetical protein